MSAPDFFLLVPVRLGGLTLRPGKALHASQDNIAAIQAAAGPGGTWPGSDATVAAAAAVTARRIQDGIGDAELSAIMVSAAAASASAAAAAAKAAAIHELTVTIGFAALVAAGAVLFADFPMSASPLPAGARLASLPSSEGWVGFDDPTHAVDQVEVGKTTGGAELGALVAVDVTTGTGFPKPFVAGAGEYVGMDLSGVTPKVRFSSAVNLNTLTAGSVTVKLFYTVQA